MKIEYMNTNLEEIFQQSSTFGQYFEEYRSTSRTVKVCVDK